MKSTSSHRSIANPRRTTLAHLEDADDLTTQAVRESEQNGEEAPLPSATANPRRTTLVDSPAD
ncbi:hypothetical protein [Streptomyces sulphureus]|uniref:hypothetical protein n=1 Tax=Streptomyces sulphureus TaxID=47758 RepID=UPI00037B8D28|nr:hypothetical protein [Streptomyces sulphureus]